MSTDDGGDRRPCSLCGNADPVEWMILSRYVLGTAKGYAFMGSKDDNDEEGEWIPPCEEHENGVAAGGLYCFPQCVDMYLRGKIVEVEAGLGKLA